MIRQFNLKMIDQVIHQLRSKDRESVSQMSLAVIKEESENKDLQEENDARRLGKFLYETKGLDKQNLGLYFGSTKEFNLLVLKEFFRQFNFLKVSIEQCWRRIFDKTGHPPEG